ncbi:MAG: FAD-dependent oxidoreductase, partial [Asgard group archaeon]|nr:FAD-dependent oxidoreductase [Asgard group archaeon]
MDDFVIVGAGPAGIFCALELLKLGYKKITLIDRGKEVYKRRCP